jgi:hypothetical protein
VGTLGTIVNHFGMAFNVKVTQSYGVESSFNRGSFQVHQVPGRCPRLTYETFEEASLDQGVTLPTLMINLFTIPSVTWLCYTYGRIREVGWSHQNGDSP